MAFLPAARFSFLTPLYDVLFRVTMPEARIRNILTHELMTADRVLEFGCGTGRNLTYASRSGAMRIGIDIDQNVLRQAQRKGKWSLVRGSQQLPFQNRTFDLTLSCLVFHHLMTHEKLEALLELYRVTQQGGRLVLIDWSQPRRLREQVGFSIVRMVDGRSRTQAHAAGEIGLMISNAGFSEVSESTQISTWMGCLSVWTALVE